MAEQYTRMQILEMIEKGEISASEGIGMLETLNGVDEQSTTIEALPGTDAGESTQVEPQRDLDETPEDQQGARAYTAGESEQYQEAEGAKEHTDSSTTSLPPDVEKWRRWWLIPLWIGVGIVVITGLLMLWAFQAAGLGFWFFCTSILFAFGLVILVLAAQSRSARWLHLRVKQKPGEWPQNIAISFPIPLRFASWMTRVFGRYIPNTPNTSPEDLHAVLDALEESATPESPLYIEVDDEDGEHVEIYIG